MDRNYSCSSEMIDILESSAKYNKFSEIYYYISLVFSFTYFLLPLCKFFDIDLAYIDYKYNYDLLYLICFISFTYSVGAGFAAKTAGSNGNLSGASQIYEIATCGTFLIAFLLMLFSEGFFHLVSAVYFLVTVVCDVYLMVQLHNKKEKNKKIRDCMNKNHIELLEHGIRGYMYGDIFNCTCGADFFVRYEDIKNIYTQPFAPEKMAYYTLLVEHSQGICMLCVEDAKYISDVIVKAKNNGVYEGYRKPSEIKFEKRYTSSEDKKPRVVPVDPRWDPDGFIICPICDTKQNSDRYRCFDCGQIFVNGQPGIPYWCGKCGHEGPYDGACPICQSTLKVNNKM